MKQGDLVEVIDCPIPYPLGLVLHILDEYCWIKFIGIKEVKWCYVNELRVVNESR